MRKIQVTLKIDRVNEETLEDEAIRDSIVIYADANNVYEAVFAAVDQVSNYCRKKPGIAVTSSITSVKEEYNDK